MNDRVTLVAVAAISQTDWLHTIDTAAEYFVNRVQQPFSMLSPSIGICDPKVSCFE